MKLENSCRKALNVYLSVEFLALKEVGSMIGVMVLNTPSRSVFTKVLAKNCKRVKISASAIG